MRVDFSLDEHAAVVAALQREIDGLERGTVLRKATVTARAREAEYLTSVLRQLTGAVGVES